MTRMRVSLDKAYMEKSQYHLPTFRLQADYEYPPSYMEKSQYHLPTFRLQADYECPP